MPEQSNGYVSSQEHTLLRAHSHEIGSAISLFQVKNYADEFRAAMEGKPVPVALTAQDETVAAVAEDIEETTKDFVIKRLSQEVKRRSTGRRDSSSSANAWSYHAAD